MTSSFDLFIFQNPSVGSFNNRPAVTAKDDVSTTLPTAPNPTIDGVLLSNSDRVLFTNLSDASLNNCVFVVSAVNGHPHWKKAVDAPSSTGEVTKGDIIFVKDGTANGEALFGWDGTAWQNLSAQVVASPRVGAPVTASSLGTVIKKVELFDAAGNSVGFIPVFDTIE